MSQKMARWVGVQDQTKLAKNSKTRPLVTSHTEDHKLKTETRRLPESVLGLNSSLAAGDVWPKNAGHHSGRCGR